MCGFRGLKRLSEDERADNGYRVSLGNGENVSDPIAGPLHHCEYPKKHRIVWF